jgi:hypothetical protein
VADQVPQQAQLFATGGPEVPRHIFYVRREVEGVWRPEGIAARIRGDGAVYVIARTGAAAELESLGRPVLIAQSTRTHREIGPQDRFALFRLDRPKK